MQFTFSTRYQNYQHYEIIRKTNYDNTQDASKFKTWNVFLFSLEEFL